MRHITKIIFFLVLSVLFIDCKKEVQPVKPLPTPFSVMAEATDVVSSSGGQVKVDITGQTDGWWVVIPSDASGWCSCSRVYGSGNATISFTFKANASGANRSVSVQFNPTFDLQAQTLTFSQN